jgi:gliding motility-associated-like protein
MQIDPDSAVCKGEIAALGLRKNSAGGAQTYTWQTASSPTATFTNVSGVFTYPYYEAAPTTTGYYRVAVTCGTSTVYSSPIQIIVNAELEPGTYTINSAQPTGGINFSTFRHAVKALKCGFKGNVVFNVNSANGPYNEQVIMPDLLTSPTKTVTFNCNGAVLQYKPKRRAESAVLKLNGTDYVTIDSLTVNVVDTTFGFGIQLINNADYNTIKRCTINANKDSTYLTYAGIVMNPDSSDAVDFSKASLNDSNLIVNNTVNGGYYGITCTSVRSTSDGITKSIGNIIRNNTIKDPYAYGIYISGASPTVVDSNDISQPTRKVLIDFTGIMIKENTFGATISRNKIHNILEQGKSSVYQIDGIKVENVLALQTSPNIICNNALYYFKGNGYQQGLVNASSSYLKFYHNTVSLDDTAARPISTNPTRGFGSFGLSNEGVEFKNNIIVIRRGGAGDKYCVYMNFDDSSLVANYNNYYIAPATTGSTYMGVMGGRSYATLADWLATRKDSSSISMDPVFYDLSVGDLTPTKIPFENRGTNAGITNDIWNVTRSTIRPDIGAFEFTICRDLTTPVITVDSGGVNALKFSWNAIQNTSGYRVSRDGLNWSVPSSGAFGTSHIISGLKPTDTVGLMVKALGSRIDCPEYLSQRVVGRTLTDGIFIPNTFTPNGNGQNDVFKVYTNMLKSVHWMVFNQWGEKVFETTELQGTWDGSYKGKPQPVGVYVYVMVGTLADGNKVTQKGTFNLIR